MLIPKGSEIVLKSNEFYIGQKVLFSMLPASSPRATTKDCTAPGIIISTRAHERGYAKNARDMELFKIGMFTDENENEIEVSISWIHQSEILEVLDENLHIGQDLIQNYLLRCKDSEHTQRNTGLDDNEDV